MTPGRKCAAPLVAVALLAMSGCASGAVLTQVVPGVDATGKVTGLVSSREHAGDLLVVDSFNTVALSRVIEVATTGEVSGNVDIRIPIEGGSQQFEVVFALTAETVGGPVEILPAKVDGNDIVLRTTHLSLFQTFAIARDMFGIYFSEAVDELWDSGNSADADPPECSNQREAHRGGIEVGPENYPGVTLMSCIGMNENGRYLTVVNNRRFALLLTIDDGTTVLEEPKASEDVAQLIDSVAPLDGLLLLAPRDSVTLDIDDLEEVQATNVGVEFGHLGNFLAQLQFGVDVFLSITSLFGAEPAPGTPAAVAIQMAFLEHQPCLESIDDTTERMIASCFNEEIIEAVMGGGAAKLLSLGVLQDSEFWFETHLTSLPGSAGQTDRYAVSVAVMPQ